MASDATREKPGELNPASEGKGPLLQRDYWAVLDHCPFRPRELIAHVAARFCEFPPPELVLFEMPQESAALHPGDELGIDIRGAGRCGVRVVHRDANSFTLLTLKEHPEAGRITFGAYPSAAGDVIFHIRSRARASSSLRHAEFIALGDAMQISTWTEFINRLAAATGSRVRGEIHVDSEEVEDTEADSYTQLHEPTFLARGD